MPLQNPKKFVIPEAISCGESANMTISFEAAASLSAEPADIILIMDHSSSMWPPRMADAQTAANTLIDMVAAASGGENAIENGSRIGIVSFSSNAEMLLDFSTDTAVLHDAINSIVFGGGTNHQQAFEVAESMLPPKTQKRQILVMFTDGVASGRGNPDPVAQRIKDSGAEIYCIGLLSDNTDLNKWASTPLETHVAMTDDSAQLMQIFRKIGAEILLAGAYDAALQETVTQEFEITEINAVSHGSAQITGAQSLSWTPGTLGVAEKPETVSLSFQIRHIGKDSGVRPVNAGLTYEDRDGNILTFPSPVLQIQGISIEILPEPCPEPTEFTIPGCKDGAHISLADTTLSGLGRIVQLDVTLKAICPGKRVAASIILMEISPDGTELPRGVKHLLVPAQEGTACQDITLKCIRFSLPEALDAAGNTDSLCNPRQFAGRVLANYVDTDLACCDTQATIL